MKFPVFVFFVFFALFGRESESKCEDPSDYPVMTPGNEEKYLCFVLYQLKGHPKPTLACNGDAAYLEDESYESAPEGQYFPFGSAIVKAGCTLHGYPDFNYTGTYKVFKGPVQLNEVPGLIGGDDPNDPEGFRSYLCECEMKSVTCVPEDYFEVVLTCDASGAASDFTCSYRKTVGTSFSTSISDSMSIDSTIAETISKKFFDLFEATLNISTTTNYNWGTISEEEKSQQVTTDADATTPPGQILIIKQAVGHCDRSYVKTEMFSITYTTTQGEIISSKIVHAKDL